MPRRNAADELVDAIDELRNAHRIVFLRAHWQNARVFTDADREEARANVRAARDRLLKAVRAAVRAAVGAK